VTIIGCLLAAAGLLGIVYHLAEFKAQHPFQYEIVWITFVRLLAIVAGVYMLLGRNWARWLGLAWMALHVGVSAFHSVPELAMHGVLLAVFAYFLLRTSASEYFRMNKRQ
jgi:hypothetical protein